MARSPLFARVSRALRLAHYCERHGLSTADGIARLREAEREHSSLLRTRREWLKTVMRAGAAGAAAAMAAPAARLGAITQKKNPSLDVGIVGAGLAGLACADRLASRGATAAIYEASARVGGRVHSLRGLFPGQVAERGAEFIDNPHKVMLGYARRFDLATEDVLKLPGDVVYYFNNQFVAETDIVDEFREFVAAMRVDLRTLSSEPSALTHNDADVAIDQTSLLAYLEGANGSGVVAGPNAKAAIAEAYVAEYGLEPDEQSCLNFLLFIHADRRSKFTPFGSSDERYHLLDGNDGITTRLAQSLPRAIEHGMRLTRARKTSSGAIELSFETPGGPVIRTHDAAVHCDSVHDTARRRSRRQPESARGAARGDRESRLRDEREDDGRLHQPAVARRRQQRRRRTRIWRTCRRRGRPTRRARARRARSSPTTLAAIAAPAIDPANLSAEAALFIADLDKVYPGAQAAARRVAGAIVAHLEHWPTEPADARQLHLLQARTVHDDRRP